MRFKARCEFCGEFLSEEGYYSLSNCDETGKGVFLCKSCAAREEALLFEQKCDADIARAVPEMYRTRA